MEHLLISMAWTRNEKRARDEYKRLKLKRLLTTQYQQFSQKASEQEREWSTYTVQCSALQSIT